MITSNPSHPAFHVDADNLHIIYQKRSSLGAALERLKKECGCESLTVQSGGTVNGLFLREKLLVHADEGVLMKLIQTKCPNCNADLQIDENLKVCYCTYCGSKVLIDDESITENINIKLDQTITHRSIDETKLKELEYENEIRRAQMENHAKLAADKQKLEREKQERYQAEMGSYQTKIGRWKIGLLLYFVINVIFVFVGPSVNASLGQTILIVWIFFIIVGLVILVILKSRKPKMK